MAEPERYHLGVDELLGFAARAGLKSMRHAERREVALLARVLDRDAPIIAAATPDKRWVIFRLRLPLRVPDASAAVAALNAVGGPYLWTFDPARSAVTVAAPVPIAGVLYTDSGVSAILTALRETAHREARSFRP